MTCGDLRGAEPSLGEPHVESKPRGVAEIPSAAREPAVLRPWLWSVIGASAGVLGITTFFLFRLRRFRRLLEEARSELQRSQIDLRNQTHSLQSIRKLNAELEQRVQDRTLQLQAANKELESFCYSVSHDLRSPLRSIDGFSRVLLEEYSSRLDEDGQDSLQRVRAASQRMGLLIDDLLTLSRTTRAELHRSPLDLTALARQLAADFAHAEPNRDVEWIIAPGLIAHADPALLHQVLQNLLSNAWKFTSRLPRARIEVGRAITGGETAFYVRDNGAGFDMALASRLFGAFQRLHTVGEFPGTGVGLANVQRIVHRHGGRVWAEGKTDGGATFFFTLPEPHS